MTLVLILSSILPGLHLAPIQTASANAPPAPAARVTLAGPFRTRVTFPNSTARARLDQLDVVVLDEGPDWAQVLADGDQLEALARLRFKPHVSDDLDLLIDAHAQAKSWLAASLQPLLARASAVRELSPEGALLSQPDASASGLAEAKANLHAAMHALSPEQQAGIAALTSVDDDADGLTNTQEQWWCTDPLDNDSDGDGVSDGNEAQAAKDWLANERSGPPAAGKPFSGWPSLISGCPDDDNDDIPDLAERWELGLNMNNPSTDRDRYSDGMELFGLDSTGAMSPIVRPPGDHPMVAAYPVIHVDAVPGTFHVETVTELHLDQTVITGTAKTYGTSETRGVSDSVADTVTWNEWQEVSTTRPQDMMLAGFAGSRLVQTSLQSSEGVCAAAWNPDALDKVFDSGLDLTLDVCGLVSPHPVGLICDLLSIEKSSLELGYALGSLFGPPAEAQAPENASPESIQSDVGPNSFECPEPYVPCGRYTYPTDQQIIEKSSQERLPNVGGTSYGYNTGSSTWTAQPVHPIAYPMPSFVPYTTVTHGSSRGGAHTTTHTEYQEHTVSQSEQFSSEQGWTSGWAKNTAHTADLTFSYRISNAGTDYARELSNLIFNVYIGRDPYPAFTCQMHDPPPDRNCNLVSLTNVMPGDQHTYTTGRVWLSFEQMQALDLGGPIYVVVDSYSLGEDDVFFENARQGGMTVLMDDGVADGDEAMDVYVLPTWEGDTVLDVLARYFPDRRDAEGNLLAISTPEWTTPPAWIERPLTDASWFNLYLDNLGDGSTPFRDTPAQPNSTMIMRYQTDSDYDGYSDRSELRLGTDPDNPASHPSPGLVASLNTTRVGDEVTGRLAFLNTGNYDAYGVEAIMYAPDRSVSIGNNTIGGGGRVKAASQVVLGSRVLSPGLGDWRNSTASPYSAGSYSGNTDKVFTFTADSTGAVGSTQPITLTWSDGGNSGALQIPAGYQSPLPLSVSQGVEVGFYSGSIVAGDAFTVAAQLPRDTFTYTVLSEPYTEPGVVVSYNDPQGNHRFVTSLGLSDLGADLAPYADQMLAPLSLEIATSAPFTPTGSNTTHYVFNLPDSCAVEDGHLFVEYVKDDGTLVAEQVFTQTLQPGPNVIPVTWDTSIFTETYQSDHDYNILALVTDWQGNIIQSMARPLFSFQADPKPVFAMDAADTTWDFGTATQGEVLEHTFTFANTGFLDLLTYVSAPAEMDLSQRGSRLVAPADIVTYTLTLHTADLPVGPYDETITIRTSDPDEPETSVQVTGTITDAVPSARVRDDHPLDLIVTIPGDHSAHEWITFTHTLGPDPQSLHPVKVYSQTNGTLLGVGRYATPFGGEGTAFFEMFGDGSDGDLVVGSGETAYTDDVRAALAATANSGDLTLTLATTGIFTPGMAGDEVLVIQMQGTGAGNYEFGIIAGVDTAGGMLTLTEALSKTYSVGGSSKVQVLRVPHYRNVTVHGTLTAQAWNGSTGGIVAVRVSGVVIVGVGGRIDATGLGFRPYLQGLGGGSTQQFQGEGYLGQGTQSPSSNATGGGGGKNESGDNAYNAKGAGGGGHATSGGNSYGAGGGVIGQLDLSQTVFLGGAGGHGGYDWRYSGHPLNDNGSRGGGIVFLFSQEIVVNGLLVANGTDGARRPDGGGHEGGSGGGAGGSIYFISNLLQLTDNAVSAIGGQGEAGRDQAGGNGGVGRIYIEYCETLSGTTNPISSTQKLDCYIIEQVESTPYNTARLNLPETFTGGHTYQVQYGRRLIFTDTGMLMTTLRVPAGTFGNATLDGLVSDVGAGPLTFTLDIGSDGSWDWQTTQNITGPVTLSSPDLVAAFNQYWTDQGMPAFGTLDVPVKVYLSQAGQVLLTNLYVPPIPPDVAVAADDITFGISPTIESEIIPVTVTLHNLGGENTGGLTAAFYAPAPGGQETYIGSAFVPNIPPSGTVQANIACNTLGFTGTLPVRVIADPYSRLAEVDETNNEASADLTILTRPDLWVPQMTLSDDEPVVGEAVTVTLTLRNGGQATAGTQTVALYDGSPEAGGTLVGDHSGSALPGGVTTTIAFTWVPTATGSHRLFAVGDRDDTVNEFDEGNNRTWQDVYVGFAGPLLLDSGTGGDLAYTTEAGYGYVDEDQPDVLSTCGGGTEPHETLRRDPDGRVVYRFDHFLPGHFYHLDVTLYECDGAGRQESVYVDGNPVAGPEDLGDGEIHRLSLRLDPALYADRVISVTIQTPGIDGAVVSEVNLHDVDYRYADAGGGQDPEYPGFQDYGWLDGVEHTDWGTLPYQSVRVDQNDNELRYRFDGLDPNKRYNVHLTFWQHSGTSRIQRVRIDGLDTGLTVDTGDYQRHDETVAVPPTAYADDGSIVVSVVRINATAGAMVNEIALEEETLPLGSQCVVQETPYFSEVYGDVTIMIINDQQPAPVGTVVQAINPRGDTVGCFTVSSDGLYGFMRIYGEDASANPPIPGMRDGELVAFRVNGAPARATPLFYWHDDHASHRVDLVAGSIEGQSVLFSPGWNLFSFRLNQVVPSVPQVLSSIDGRYDRVLGEEGVYVPDLPDVYNTLRELHAGLGYYLRITSTTSVPALIEGMSTPVTTPIPLHTGWNWIGYLPETTLPITVALQSVEGYYQRVLSLDKTYDPALPEFSTLHEMEPGRGYLIYANDVVTLTYPAGTGMTAHGRVGARTAGCGTVSPTPQLTLMYGQVEINGDLAPVGTRVEVVTPRGKVAGCFIVETAGQFGLMHVYGEDATANPVIGGFRPGEPLAFRVNGFPVELSATLTWQDNREPHVVSLSAIVHSLYLPLVGRGW